MEKYWNYSIDELIKKHNITAQGLDNKAVEEARSTYGKNALQESKHKSIVAVFIGQFVDLLVIILLVAAIVSIFSGNVESTLVILVVLVINAILGTIQHSKAQKSLDSLKQLSSPIAKVRREGEIKQINSIDIVPGDIVLLEAGDMIIADGRILQNYSLQVNESSLTGESANVDKTKNKLVGEIHLADRTNMVYSGSLVTYGRAEVYITSTGMNTEIGKIAGLMNNTRDRETPLQVSLDQFSQKLALLIMVICGVVFGLCMYRNMNILDSLMFAVALAVAAIPEALGSIVTIVQAIGTQRMTEQNAVIKELRAVESLGCVSVICSDKTGTLTQNKMQVKHLYIDGESMIPETVDMHKKTNIYLIYNAILNNDSNIVDGKGIGDPTEYALLEMFHLVRKDENISESDIRQLYPRIEELPFDSDRKLMSVKCKIDDKVTILTKGAIDILLTRCVSIEDLNGIRPITLIDKESIQRQNYEYSKQGLRVLAFAYKHSNEKLSFESEENLIFSGLISMMDPPRVESVKAVQDAKRAGIHPVMITGDHRDTAVAIATEIGIFESGHIAVTGAELDAMGDQELEQNIEDISVYARVSPENKIRIVEAWQNKGNIVAMTGDGVNDAPALKKADIGVAMGITGTEVSKDASDMILTDDNFATIIKAVTNGRNIYRNIKNAILFLLSGNMAGILSVLYTSIAGLPVPFAAVQLLFINLLTDSLPAVAIGMEPVDTQLLNEKPRDQAKGILTLKFFIDILWQGTLIAVSTLIAYHIGLKTDAKLASTLAFSTLTLARLFHGFNNRGKKSVFKLGILSNKYSIFAFIGGVVLLGAVLMTPALHGVFYVSTLSLRQYIYILALALVPTVVIQTVRVIKECK